MENNPFSKILSGNTKEQDLNTNTNPFSNILGVGRDINVPTNNIDVQKPEVTSSIFPSKGKTSSIFSKNKTSGVPDILGTKREEIIQGGSEVAKSFITPMVREGISLIKGQQNVFSDILSRAKTAVQERNLPDFASILSPIPTPSEAKKRFLTLTGTETTPTTELQKSITGSEKPFSLQTEGKEVAGAFGFDVKNPFLAGGIGVLGSVLDFTGFGGEKKAVTALTKAKTAEEAAGYLKNMGIAESALPKLTDDLISIPSEVERKKWVDNLVTTFKNPVETKPITSLPEEKVLIDEARKFPTPEDYIQQIKGGKTQYGAYSPEIRSTIPAGYTNITELGVDPDEMVTIYRGIDDISGKVKRKINDGDFVTTDFDSALSYTGDPKDVVEMRVKAKDLYNSEPKDFVDEPFYTGAEYIYTTKKAKTLPTDAELTNIWNKANEVTPPTHAERSAEIKSLIYKGKKEEALVKADQLAKDVNTGKVPYTAPIRKEARPKKSLFTKVEKQVPEYPIKQQLVMPEKSKEVASKMSADLKRKYLAAESESIKKRLIEEDRLNRQARINNTKYTEPYQKPLGMFGKLRQALNPIKYLEKSTQDDFRIWDREIKKAKVLGDKEIGSVTIPKENWEKFIDDYEAGVPTKYSSKVQAKFDDLFEEGKNRGLDVKYSKNYLPHVYEESPSEITEKIGKYLRDNGMSESEISEYMNGKKLGVDQVKRLGLNPFFIKERTIPTYAQARGYGLTPKFKDPDQMIAYYRENMERNIANQKFIDKLVYDGKIRLPENAPDNWKALELGFSPKGYYAEPRLANTLNAMFRNEDELNFGQALTKAVAQTSKKMQEITLSAGVPASTFNFFSIGQAIKQITSGNFKVVAPLLRANFNKRSIKFLRDNQKTLEQMAEEGIDLGDTIASYKNLHNKLSDKFNYSSFKGQDRQKIFSLFGEAFNKAFNEKTFGSFMPQMHMQYFKDTFEQGIKKGLSEKEAQEIAGKVTRNMFGLMDTIGRSQGTKDALSAAFFAPGFREGIINTLLNTGKAGGNLLSTLVGLSKLDPTLQGNRKLLGGMVITYGLYNALNYKLNGNYMWDNPENRKYALKVPYNDGKDSIYIEFMPSFLAFARNMLQGTISLGTGDIQNATQKLGSVFSMPIKIVTEILGNSDYFGNKIYKPEDTALDKQKKIAKYLFLAVNHPYISEIMKVIDGKQPMYQAIAKMSELPIKFASKATESNNEYYRSLDKIAARNAKDKATFKPQWDEIQKLVNEGKEDEAQKIIDNFSDKQKSVYKVFLAADKRAESVKLEKEAYATYRQLEDLVKSGKTDKANEILANMSDEEYTRYEKVLKKFKEE